MENRILNEEALAECVGMVTIKWGVVEGAVKALIYDLAAYISPAIDSGGDDVTYQILLTLLENMELRASIANAKALAYEVKDIPGFYDRVEALLNRIDNQHRNERNRYVHDQWHMVGPIIMRTKRGTSVERKQGSGEKVMRHRTTKQYLGPNELIQFARTLQQEADDLFAIGDELRLRLEEIRPL